MTWGARDVRETRRRAFLAVAELAAAEVLP